MSDEKALAKPAEDDDVQRALVAAEAPTGIDALFNFANAAEAFEVAKWIADSNLVPKDYQKKPQDVFAAWAFGNEVGLPPMASLRYVSLVNGRPAIHSDGSVAVMMRHPDFVDMIESFDEDLDGGTATCTVKRRGRSDVTQTFSAKDRDIAGLKNVHETYPRRMLQWRARHLAMRDLFADAFSGLMMESEARDMQPPPEREIEGETVAKPPPASKAAALIDKLPEPTPGPKSRAGSAAGAPSKRADDDDIASHNFTAGTRGDAKQEPDAPAGPSSSSASSGPPTTEEILQRIEKAQTRNQVADAMADLNGNPNVDDGDRESIAAMANKKLEGLKR